MFIKVLFDKNSDIKKYYKIDINQLLFLLTQYLSLNNLTTSSNI